MTPFTSAIVSPTGKTRLTASLERAREGKGPSVGQWLMFPGATLARTVAELGEDWVLVDCEHGNIADTEMYAAVAAIAAGGASPIVRIPGSDHWMLKRALDCGAHGVMVPMCETKEQALAVAAAAKYPPQGTRGAGGLFAPPLFGQNAVEYMRTANENITVIVQIESRVGVENCEEIAAVEGVDMLFIGPNDLASSMGYFAFDHAAVAEVQEATQKVLDAAKRQGKWAGHFCLGAEIAAQRYKQGFELVNCGADVVAVGAWMTGEMAKLKGML